MAAIVLAIACSTDQSPTGVDITPREGRESFAAAVSDTIPNSYIVNFTRSAARTPEITRALAATLHQRYGGRVVHIYDRLGGYAVENVSPATAALLSKEPGVAYVEPNMIVHPSVRVEQANPGNGLDRLNQIYRPLDQMFSYAYDGEGVHVYILDTGVDTTSGEFAGRVGQGVSCSLLGEFPPYHSSDQYGHGTAVASIAVGTTYGVAKKATLHSVRISWGTEGGATTADQNCGINWIANNAIYPAVANLSFGGYPNAFSTRDAINYLILQRNVSFVKSAGNDYRDAWEDRANRASYEWVVGALNPTNDTFAYFPSGPNPWGSNWGTSAYPTVNMIAPGVNVLAADKFNPGYATLRSGTSMAAPYVTGVIAQYLQTSPAAVPWVVYDAINNYMTTYGIVQGLTGVAAQTPNKALHSVLWCAEPAC